MIARHFFRSMAKLDDVVPSIRSSAASENITRPAEGEADQPFCGAEIRTSTPTSFMSTQTQPLAMQSSTKSAPASWAARASALR